MVRDCRIASRDGKARQAAQALGIPKAYGSYEELLADPSIEAIYNPLPNNLHVPWSARAAEAGKHVLCEKPLGVNAADAENDRGARPHGREDRRGVHGADASAVAAHAGTDPRRPHRRTARGMGFFSYFNRDPENIRNILRMAAGRCSISAATRSRFAIYFRRGAGARDCLDRARSGDEDGPADVGDPEFPSGQAIFTCSTQLAYNQRILFSGRRAASKLNSAQPAERPAEPHPDRRQSGRSTGAA